MGLQECSRVPIFCVWTALQVQEFLPVTKSANCSK